jgi:hypothetical protein
VTDIFAILGSAFIFLSGGHMASVRRVLLCGKSLLICGVQATLESAPDLDLQLVEPQPDLIRERIIDWEPEILILETDLLSSHFPLGLLADFPKLKLVGLDIEDNRLLVVTGQAAYGLTSEELLIELCKPSLGREVQS